MTSTEQILHNFLTLSLGSLILGTSACAKHDDGTYCITVDEDSECPSPEEITEKYLPESPECESLRYLEATELSSTSDFPYDPWEGNIYDTGETDPDGDTCCYKTTYREKIYSKPCAIGRPFVQRDQTILASLNSQVTSSWQRNPQKIVHPDTLQRSIAGQFYLEVARYEHASIASFNRFALELIKFGAPAELLQQAQMAAMDEIRHAQSAFAIANELLSENFQPNQMPIEGSLSPNLVSFAAAVLEEAAIQETLAVLLAAEQARVSQEPMITQYLLEVVAEESRHSELAWATLRWCIEKGGDPIIALLKERTTRPIEVSTDNYPLQAILALGLPDRESVQRIVQKGIQQVILPSLQSLLQQK